MEILHRAPGNPFHLAVFPGTFNPVTVAHQALVQAALNHVDEVVLVLPRVFPHKDYSGASFEVRAQMLCEVAAGLERVSVAASDKGLFIEIAAEFREVYGQDEALSFLCGRDAAERIANWDYGRPRAFEEMLRHFSLLVAARQGEYAPPDRLKGAVRALEIGTAYDCVSASEVRERIARGEPWEHLVPQKVHELVRRVYSGGSHPSG